MPKPFKDGLDEISFVLEGSRRDSISSETSETIDPRGLMRDSSSSSSSSSTSASAYSSSEDSLFEDYASSTSIDPIVVIGKDDEEQGIDEPMLSTSHIPTPRFPSFPSLTITSPTSTSRVGTPNLM